MKYNKLLVKKYCSFWANELQQCASRQGTLLACKGTAPEKIIVITTFRKKATVTDCGNAMIQLFRLLPGGIIGRAETFRHLASLLQLWDPNRYNSDEALIYDEVHKAKAIACYLLSFNNCDQRDLIIAFFSLCNLLAAGERGGRAKSWIIATVFAPSLLNGRERELEIRLPPPGSRRTHIRRVTSTAFQAVKHPRHYRIRPKAGKILKELPLRAKVWKSEAYLQIKRSFRRHILGKESGIGEMSKPRRLYLEHFILEMILVWRAVNRELKKHIEPSSVLDCETTAKKVPQVNG